MKVTHYTIARLKFIYCNIYLLSYVPIKAKMSKTILAVKKYVAVESMLLWLVTRDS